MINPTTIKHLVQFANSVTLKGLLNEMHDAIDMDKNDVYMNTYIQAIMLMDYVGELKKSNVYEWNELKDIKLRHWTDQKQDGNIVTFEIMLQQMNKRRCITDCMATVARYLYEEIPEKYLDKKTKAMLISNCYNDEVDIKWKEL